MSRHCRTLEELKVNIHRLLLSDPMVRADLAGQKRQTGRLVTDRNTRPDGSPRVKPGDEIWFKETCHCLGEDGYLYRATEPDAGVRWTPSSLCPDDAIRLKHVVTSVRRQKACEISEHDAWAEGMKGLTFDDIVEVGGKKKVLAALLRAGEGELYARNRWAMLDAVSRFRVAFRLMHGADALDQDVWVYGWNEEVLTEWPLGVPEGRWRYQTAVDAWVEGRFDSEGTAIKPVFLDDDGTPFWWEFFEVGETFVRLGDGK